MQQSERELPDPQEAQDMIENLNASWFAREPLPESAPPQEGFPQDISSVEMADHIIADFLRTRSAGEILIHDSASTAALAQPQELSLEEVMPEEEMPRTLDEYVEIFLLSAIPKEPQKSEDEEVENLPRLYSLYQKANAQQLREQGNIILAHQILTFSFGGLPKFAEDKYNQYVDLYDRRDDNFTGDKVAHWGRISRVTKKAYELHSRKR